MSEMSPYDGYEEVVPDGLPRSFRWVVRILGLLIVLVIVWAVFVGLSMRSAASEAELGRDLLEDVRDEPDFEQLIEAGEIPELETARVHFESAQQHLNRWWIGPAASLPFFGRQLESARAIDAAAIEIVAVAESALSDASRLMDDLDNTPAGRVAAFQELEAILIESRQRLTSLDLGPEENLIGQLSEARQKGVEEIADIVQRMEDIEVSMAGLGDVLIGPRTYVLAVGNNAEMRAGSGMILQTGLLRIENGEFTVSDMDSSYARNPETGPELSAEQAKLWGWRSPQIEWRNLALTPNFAGVTGPLAADMWQDYTGQEVDGVWLVDPVMLSGLLEITGPVSVLGTEIGSEQILQFLLVDQYLQVESHEENLGRRDALGPAAAIIMAKLASTGTAPLDIYRTLKDEALDRHFIAWSRHDREQAAFESMGIAGALDEQTLAVDVINIAGNKLDTFVDLRGIVDTEELPTGTKYTVRMRLENTATEELPVFLGGPHPQLDLEAREYVGIVSFLVPGVATEVTSDAAYDVSAEGPDGLSYTIAQRVPLKAGENATVTITFVVPLEFGPLLIEPDARADRTPWKVNGIERKGSGQLEA